MAFLAGGNRGPVPVRLPAPPKAAPPPVPSAPAQSFRYLASQPAPKGTPAQAQRAFQVEEHGPNQVVATPQYKQAVVDVFKAQPQPQQTAIVQGALKAPSTEGNVVLDYIRQSSAKLGLQPNWRAGTGPVIRQTGSPLSGIGKAISSGLGDVASGINAVQGATQIGPAGPGNVQTEGGLGTGLSRVLTNAPIDVARAAIQSPSVIPKTVKGLAESTVGMVAGGLELPIKMVTQGPGPALSNLGQQIASDYSRRYGPLASGNDQAFINRIKQQGAGPEVFDALIAAGGLDATAGRAVATVGKTGAKLTGADNFFTRPRPDLLLSGKKVRPQELGNTAGRIAAQRLEDKLRGVRAPSGELRPLKNQVAPIFQEHGMRVVHSAIAQNWRRAIQETHLREVRGKPSSALAAAGKLNNWQRQAVYHAIHGVRVDTPANFQQDLALRADQIAKDRANPASLGNRIPAQYANQVDELKLIDKLTAHADQIAGPKMVAFQAGEAARAQHLDALTNLHPATAEARRLRPLGDRLGIEHPDIAAARVASATEQARLAQQADSRTAPRASSGENLPARPGLGGDLAAARSEAQAAQLAKTPRTEQLAAYVKQVRAGMQQHGLPEPGYFAHRESPQTKFGDYTAGQGARAMPSDKMSSWALHRAGVADHSVQAYLDGLARSIKRPLQWRLTDNQFRAAAHPTPTPQEIKAALGHQKAANLLTGHELRRVLSHQGLDMNKVAFYNPGRLAEKTLADHGLLSKSKVIQDTHEAQISDELHHALTQEDIVQRGDKPPSDKFLTTQGWKAAPKTALDEIQAGLKGSSLPGRLVGKVQGTTAGLILGQNPHFLIMNTLAHAFPAIAGTKGALLPDLLKTPFWWHGLSTAQKDQVRMFEAGRAGHYNVTSKLGSQAPNQIAAFGRRLGEHGLVQKANSLNPLHAILSAENLQSNFFRHAVMYHEVKRAAYQDMAHEFTHAVAAWEQVKHVFDLGPKERMQGIMQNTTRMEALGRTTINLLGDYGRFTARERAFFNNRAVMFYSFLRHVTRTLLYVLPARHPLALGLLGELGNLHVQEVKKMLGGQDLPWAYGRLFTNPKGKLSSVDLTSTSPLSSSLIDVLAGGVKQLPRLISPAFAPLLDVMYGQTPTGTPVQRNAWTYLNDLFSLSYPYRMISAARFGLKQQQSDTFPFLHERPQNYKTAASQQYQAAKQQARGPLSQYLLGSALGIYPKPDDARVIAQHMAAKAAGSSGSLGAAVIPGSGSLGGAVIPGSGNVGGAVIP